MKLKIDPEFRALIPALSPAERDDLRIQLTLAGGATDPLTVWCGILVDGHNRYELCTELGLPFTITELDLPNRDAVKAWMFQHQIGRRNLNADQIVMLAVLHGMRTDRGTPQMRTAAQKLKAAGAYADVIAGTRTIKAALNLLNKPAEAAKPRPPAVPKPAPTDIAAARVTFAQRATDADVRKLQAKVIELEDRLQFVHSAAAHPPVIHTPSSRPKSGKRIATPVFVISDTHFGETVTLQESLGVNEYDLEIAARRMSKCWDNMLWLRKEMARTQSCDDTYLALNGDIVSGDIHAELRECNDAGLRGQCDAAVAALMPGILALAEATPGVLHIVCIGGNHGRATNQQQIKNGTDHSFEHIGIYDPLRRQIGDRRGKIAWHVPFAERFIIELHGRKISQQHGTMIKSSGGIGGPLVPMTRWVTRDAMAQLYIFGHFHEADAYGRVIKNGSLIGESAYSKWLGVEPNRPPEQVAFVLDADAGVRRFERVSVT